MERSLTVLLPVRDAQFTLTATVSELLDVLPDLTQHFELLIVDDGSKDATIEVAGELATLFPQVRVIRHGCAKGRAASIATGLRQSRGDIIFLRDDDCRLPVDQIGRLWRAMDKHELALGSAPSVTGPQWNRWRNRGSSGQPGFQMVHRSVAEPIQEALVDQTTLRDRLERLGYRWHEVEMRNRLPSRGHVPSDVSGQGASRAPTPTAASAAVASKPKAPNYLAKLKDRASDE